MRGHKLPTQELTTRGIEMTETLEAVAMERDAALVRSDQTTDKLAQVSKQLNTAEQVCVCVW